MRISQPVGKKRSVVVIKRKYDSVEFYKYELVFAAISLLKIPVLAFAVTLNGWIILFFMFFGGIFAIICDTFFGRVMAKLCRSILSILAVYLVTTIALIVIAVVFLYFYTGGQEFYSCPGDFCGDTSFINGVWDIAYLVAIPMTFILFIAMIIKIRERIHKKRPGLQK